MPTPFETAAASAVASAHQLAAVPIRYTRGATVIDLEALPGRDTTQRTRETTALAKHTRPDTWLIKPADLVDDDDEPITPAAGDLITVNPDEDHEASYRVCGDQATPPWVWSGPGKTWYRIRTEPV